MQITGLQLRLGRVALGLEQRDLAKLCGLTHSTLSKLENSGLGTMRGTASSLQKLTGTLMGCGVIFGADGLSIGLQRPRLPLAASARLIWLNLHRHGNGCRR
jgi:transcriptional regulator with XRE-family HTH domain